MDLDLYLIISSLIFVFILLHGLELYRKRRLPPGPVGLPIIGNLLDLGPKPHESLSKLALKHGPLMTIRLGSITSVVASTPDAARQILQLNDEACSGRLVPDVISILKKPDAAILWMPANDTWRAIRKALNIYLTNRQKLDSGSGLRHNVMAELVEFLRASGEKKEAVDIGKLGFAVALNQMSNTILSQNVTSYDSDQIGGFKTAVETAMEMQGKFNIADIFPVLKPLDPQNIRRQAKAAFNWLDEVIEGFVSKRIKNRELEEQSLYGDLLDSFLDYSQENQSIFCLQHIKALLVDLFIAATDTTSNTTTWAMTELLINPDILSRVREEILQTVGEDGNIEEAKIIDLPYLDAVIKETMRLHLAAPLLAPHKTETLVKVGNYILPKNTQIFVNAWAMARDPRYWENPTVFMPERFLTSNLDYKGQDFKFIPFGSGRRRCPGIPLAHRMVRLIVASFVYHFDWELPYAREEMDMNDMFGLTLLKAIPLVATPIPLKR